MLLFWIRLSDIINQLKNNPDNLIQNNNKIQTLLDSDKDQSSNNHNSINQSHVLSKNIEYINSNLNINKEMSDTKKKLKHLYHCKSHSASINSSISKLKSLLPYSIIKTEQIEYKSIYENLNKITNYNYSSNIELQNKVKAIITKIFVFKSSENINSNVLINKHSMNSFNKNPSFNSNKKKFVSTISPLSKFKNICSLYHLNSITNQKYNELNNSINRKYKSKKRNSSLNKRSETFSNILKPEIIRSTSIDNYKPKKNIFQTGIDRASSNNLFFTGKFGIKPPIALIKRHELEKQKMNNNENNIMKKMKGEKAESFSVSGLLGGGFEQKNVNGIYPNFFSKKKKGNLLSQINLNIEKTNQNLNNPDEFYSNYFISILGGGEQTKFDTKKYRRRSSAISFSNKMILSPTRSMRNKKKK